MILGRLHAAAAAAAAVTAMVTTTMMMMMMIDYPRDVVGKKQIKTSVAYMLYCH